MIKPQYLDSASMPVTAGAPTAAGRHARSMMHARRCKQAARAAVASTWGGWTLHVRTYREPASSSALQLLCSSRKPFSPGCPGDDPWPLPMWQTASTWLATGTNISSSTCSHCVPAAVSRCADVCEFAEARATGKSQAGQHGPAEQHDHEACQDERQDRWTACLQSDSLPVADRRITTCSPRSLCLPPHGPQEVDVFSSNANAKHMSFSNTATNSVLRSCRHGACNGSSRSLRTPQAAQSSAVRFHPHLDSGRIPHGKAHSQWMHALGASISAPGQQVIVRCAVLAAVVAECIRQLPRHSCNPTPALWPCCDPEDGLDGQRHRGVGCHHI